MAAAKRLPPSDVIESLAAPNAELKASREATVGELKSLLCSLLQARARLLVEVPEVKQRLQQLPSARGKAAVADSSPKSLQRRLLPRPVLPLSATHAVTLPTAVDAVAASTSTSDLWAALDAGWEALAPFRDATLDDWARRLAYAGGKLTAKRAATLKTLSAPFSEQITALLAADGPRLRARVAAVPPPGTTLGVPKDTTGADVVYDDGEFFAALVRDAAAATPLTADGRGAAAITAPALNPKAGYTHTTRAGVDRHASKARRMKYVVHPKLVAFAAAAPYAVPPDLLFDLDTVVASLFKAST